MFKLEIETDNAAFEDFPGTEVARLLGDVAVKVEQGQGSGTLRDVNGNIVGSFEFTEEG